MYIYDALWVSRFKRAFGLPTLGIQKFMLTFEFLMVSTHYNPVFKIKSWIDKNVRTRYATDTNLKSVQNQHKF